MNNSEPAILEKVFGDDGVLGIKFRMGINSIRVFKNDIAIESTTAFSAEGEELQKKIINEAIDILEKVFGPNAKPTEDGLFIAATTLDEITTVNAARIFIRQALIISITKMLISLSFRSDDDLFVKVLSDVTSVVLDDAQNPFFEEASRAIRFATLLKMAKSFLEPMLPENVSRETRDRLRKISEETGIDILGGLDD